MNPELALQLYTAAGCIGFVLIVMNLFDWLSPKSFVDISWSWVTVVLVWVGWWLGPRHNALAVLVGFVHVLYAMLIYLRTYYWLQHRGS